MADLGGCYDSVSAHINVLHFGDVTREPDDKTQRMANGGSLRSALQRAQPQIWTWLGKPLKEDRPAWMMSNTQMLSFRKTQVRTHSN